MPYPPAVPPNTRVNSTPQADAHPSDHNGIANALTDIVNELGANPRGTFPTVMARLDDDAANLAALTTKVGRIQVAAAAANTGSRNTLGLFDVVGWGDGVTFGYPVMVLVSFTIRAGFGSGPAVYFTGDLYRSMDGAVVAPLGNRYRANQGDYTDASGHAVWGVPAGQPVGFKLRCDFIDLGGANGYAQASASVTVVPA
ncbi:MAG: hypothetical protein ABW122_14300 [Ilumatobacteraceae bacterium]